jgi:hypothetical protein
MLYSGAERVERGGKYCYQMHSQNMGSKCTILLSSMKLYDRNDVSQFEYNSIIKKLTPKGFQKCLVKAEFSSMLQYEPMKKGMLTSTSVDIQLSDFQFTITQQAYEIAKIFALESLSYSNRTVSQAGELCNSLSISASLRNMQVVLNYPSGEKECSFMVCYDEISYKLQQDPSGAAEISTIAESSVLMSNLKVYHMQKEVSALPENQHT